MTTNSVTSLADWIDHQIGPNRAYASNSELARVAGLSETTIRRLRAGEEPGIRTLRKLANGLNYPIEELQKMAGILADDQEVQDDITNYIMGGIKRLPPAKRKTILAMIRALLEDEEDI